MLHLLIHQFLIRFAFIEFGSDQHATKAIQLKGIKFNGNTLKIGRSIKL